MGFTFNLSKSPKFNETDPINMKTIFDLGIFLKLPKNFLRLVDEEKIKLHRFDELVKKKEHKWLMPILGSPCFGPLHEKESQYQEKVVEDVYNNDIEEAWILGGTFKDRGTVAPYSQEIIIDRGMVDNKFIYELEGSYLGDDYIMPWKNIIPGFIKSKELGWIGWAYVNTDAANEQRNSKFLITWNHHRMDSCYNDLHKKIKKFFTITGASFRWLMGRSSVDDEWEQFLREYDIYVIGKYRKK